MECRLECDDPNCWCASLQQSSCSRPQRKVSFVSLLDTTDFPEVPSLEWISQNPDFLLTTLSSSETVQATCSLTLDLLAPQEAPHSRKASLKKARRKKASKACRKRIPRSRHRYQGRFTSNAQADALQKAQGNSIEAQLEQ